MDSYNNNYYGWDDIEDDKLPSPILFDELLANPPRCSATKKCDI